MTLKERLMHLVMERCGGVLDLQEHPEVFHAIVDEVITYAGPDNLSPAAAATTAPPFDISWMDSWVAHRVFGEKLAEAELKNRKLAFVLRSMADARFNARLEEIQRYLGRLAEPPDGGPPEPGTPPAGPASFGGFFDDEPPDGGTPEPGVPNPPPPPPAGPDSSRGFAENPWILYWFVSLRTSLLLDVIDLHITRRLEALRKSG